jgi:NADH-quinone oxidoreductase subunit L
MALLEFDPQVDFHLLFAALILPLVGYVAQIFLGRRLPRGDWILTGGLFATMCITLYMLAKALAAAYRGESFLHHSGEEAGLWFHWLFSSEAAAGASANVSAAILYDVLGAAMLAAVGVVSFFVHLFSIGYMHGDRRYRVFFANISLFTFAMLGLVLADNMLFLFIFWEIMGLMSYLLIGHFGHDPTSPRIRQAAAACKKAFLTTRVGDVCLFVGMMMFYVHFDTFRFTELWRMAQEEVARHGGEYPMWMSVAGLFVFGGTVGKSAQFPLHIWLPDAMEGPTPVSAMIHAATMVAAGVFLLGRTYPLMSPEVLAVVTVVGTFTALFAATIGTTVFDVKGVLAYSTISQLGFMVAAVGLGGVVAGMFHMLTHAFFKACLFLCAGSVIHGCHHEQDMRRMGGLRRFMPVTFACMLVSTLAISGLPLFSGFYSKDKIVMAAFESSLAHFSGASLFAAIALPVAAALTAFYMFRLIFMTFFGEYRGLAVAHAPAAGYGHEVIEHGLSAREEAGAAVFHAAHDREELAEALAEAHPPPGEHAHDHGQHLPHESPWPMTVALSALALLGIFGGHLWLNGDLLGSHTWFETLVTPERLYGAPVAEAIAREVSPEIEHQAHTLALAVSLSVALLGILIAWLVYGRGWQRAQAITGRVTGALGEAYHAVARKYYIDELVNASAVRGSMLLAAGLTLFDRHVVDGLVNLVGRTGRSIGFFSGWFDRTFVDGAVNGVALLTQAFGSVVRLFQTGRVQQYAAFAVAGGLAVAAWLILL